MKKNTITQNYNKDWQKKILDEERMNSQQRVFDTFSNLFNDILGIEFKGKILDLGCGDGALVNLLNTKKNIEAKGIDINQGINFESDSLPFKNKEFDIIIMYSVIEHLYDPGNILVEISKILKNNGHIIIITSNFDLSHLRICDRGFYNDPTHVHPYNPISIQHLMRLYNFEKSFIGLWTVKKSSKLWKLPMKLQFYVGSLLPFRGDKKLVPSFLKGKSKTMICVFKNVKENNEK